MNKLFRPALPLSGALSLLLLLANCGGENKSQQSENSAAFDSVKISDYSGNTAVAVTYSVKNYEEWLKVYTDVSDPESRLSVYASPDDPNLITVFALTKSHRDAKNAFDSDASKKAMEDEGVTSPPVLHYYDVKYRASVATDKLYRLGVSHAVANYDQWKKVFDEDEPVRKEAGLELRAISTNADDPSVVNIMFATNDVDKAKDLIHSDDLKKRMAEGGVRSEPEVTVLKVPKP
ncbi:MAG: hypothetical protein WDN75_05890 [Bacteroidota bacterium]